jgi:predicted transcriptional regulator
MTPAEYSHNVAARFGNGKLPHIAALAAMESSLARPASNYRGSYEANLSRMAQTKERDDATIPQIIAIIEAEGPQPRGHICTRLNLSEDIARRILRRMCDEGMITSTRGGRFLWSIAESPLTGDE